MDYTERINGFQIRDVVYVPGYEPSTPRPQKFDIVKWYNESASIDLSTGEKAGLPVRHCYSIGQLVWDDHSKCFELHSVGMRWLEEEVPAEFCRVISAFAAFKTAEYRSLDDECNY